jgi:predicted permease
VLLRPLPFESPDRLATVWTEIPSQGVREGRSAYWHVDQWRRVSRSFTDIAVYDPVSVTLTQAGQREQISVVRASANLFPLLGIRPSRGRLFTSAEADDRRRVAVISHRFWQTRLGGSDDAIGQTLQLDGLSSEIVGILPETLTDVLGADVWEPQTLFPDWETRRAVTGAGSWFVVGRLGPGVSFDQARTEMNAIASRLDAELPAIARGRRINLVPLGDSITGAGPRVVLWMLTGAALLLLLVAAANVAGLSLARSVGRVPEMAIRAALGASRARIVRLLLAESMTVAAVSAVLGLLLATAGTRAVKVFGPANLARLQQADLDWRVFGWALAISVATGVLVGLAPAATMWRRDLRAAGVEGGRGIAGGAATRLRRLFVVAECAVAMMLLAGAGLLVRSWWNVMSVDRGFDSDRVMSLAIASPASMENAQRAGFYESLIQQVASLPGVERAGISSELFVGNVAEQIVTAEGTGRAPGPLQLRKDEIAGAFFETLGTPLIRGRFFSSTDGRGTGQVAIVNEAMATRVWPGVDPVGRRFVLGTGPNAPSFTVVGVVGNMRRQNLETEPIPQVFEPLTQNPSRRRVIMFVRTSTADPLPLVGPLRAAVTRVDANAFVYGVSTVNERLAQLLSQRRLQTTLLTAFSVVALLLATIGLYGLIQYSVAARTQEIGVRMALGARAGDIFRMVVREGLVLCLGGLALGIFGAMWLGSAASTLLFGVSATDATTLVSVSLLLLAIAAAACCLPALRAMRVAPTAALRYE